MLKRSPERQVGFFLSEIRDDHKMRYQWALSKLQPEDVVLDAGCGIGYGSKILSAKVKHVTGVDISEESIQFASDSWSGTNIDYIVRDLQELGALNKRYSSIVSFEVIEHLISPESFLATAHKILQPSGKIFISVPNESKVHHAIEMNPYHFKHYSETEILNLLERYGFSAKQISGQNESTISEQERNGAFIIIEAMVKPTVSNVTAPVDLLSRFNKEMTGRAKVITELKRKVEKLIKMNNELNTIKNSQAGSPSMDRGDGSTINRLIASLQEMAEQATARILTNSTNSQIHLESIDSNLAKVIPTLPSSAHWANKLNDIESSLGNVREWQFSAFTKIIDSIFELSKNLDRITTQIAQHSSSTNDRLDNVDSAISIVLSSVRGTAEAIPESNGRMEVIGNNIQKSIELLISMQNKSPSHSREIVAAIAEIAKEIDSRVNRTEEEVKSIRTTADNQRAEANKTEKSIDEMGRHFKSSQSLLVDEVKSIKNELTKFNEEMRLLNAERLKIIDESSKRIKKMENENDSLRKNLETITRSHRNLGSQNAILRKSISESQRPPAPTPKEPPSISYISKKLLSHNFYLPFLGRAIRNSLGIRKNKKKK